MYVPSPSLPLGWLTKQVGRFKNWHKRYFVLYDTSLSYYKEEMDEDEVRRGAHIVPLYTPCIRPSYTFVAAYAPMYTQYTCIYTI